MEIIEQVKQVTINENGLTTVAPSPVEEGLPALKRVDIEVDVPSGEIIHTGSLNVTTNGTYTSIAGTAYSEVDVNVPDSEEGLAAAKAEGKAEQLAADKSEVVSASPIIENGTKTILGEEITINVPSNPEELQEKYDEGKEDGTAEGKAAQLIADKAVVASASPITTNGTKSILDTEVIVNVPSDPEELQAKYDEGEAAGKAEQLSADKNAVAAISPIVENGTKTVLDTVITINVPDSEEGLAAAKAEGKAEQLTTDKAAVVAVSPITENGTKTILGENVVVNVPASEEELNAAKAEQLATDKAAVSAISPITTNGDKTLLGETLIVDVQPTASEIAAIKAEQAVADKSAVEAISPITSNGTKTVQLGSETASLTIDVESGTRIMDASTIRPTDAWNNTTQEFDLSDFKTCCGSYFLTDYESSISSTTKYQLGDIIFDNPLLVKGYSYRVIYSKQCSSFGDIQYSMDDSSNVGATLTITNAQNIGNVRITNAKEGTYSFSSCGHIDSITIQSNPSMYTNVKVPVRGTVDNPTTIDNMDVGYFTGSSSSSGGSDNVVIKNLTVHYPSSLSDKTKVTDTINAKCDKPNTLSSISLFNEAPLNVNISNEIYEEVTSKAARVEIKGNTSGPYVIHNLHFGPFVTPITEMIIGSDELNVAATIDGDITIDECPSLTNVDLGQSFKFILDRSSFLKIVNALPDVSDSTESHKINISTATRSNISDEDVQMTESKGWSVVSK